MNRGKTIENAKLQLVGLDEKSKLPSYVKLIRIDGAYFFSSFAGAAISGNFQVIISADGFGTYQQKVNFPSCKIENYTIKLKPLTNERSTSILTGSVYDANGSVIVEAKVTAVNHKGEKFEALTKEDGTYLLNLIFNPYMTASDFREAKYDITVEMNGFKKAVIKDFVFVSSQFGKMQLDIALEIGRWANVIPVSSKKAGKSKNKNKE